MNQPAQRRDGARTMIQTYPIPGMPYRIDWAKFHPHNVALREETRRKAQDRAHAVALSTDVEVECGRVMPHFFEDYDVHEGVSLTAAPAPAIGQHWPRAA